MKAKRFLSLFMAIILCMTPFSVFAEEEFIMEQSPFDEYVDYSNKYDRFRLPVQFRVLP